VTVTSQDYVVEVLRDVPGLHYADGDVLAALAERVELRVMNGGWICREGDAADALYIVGDGEVEVVKASAGGKNYVVATLTAGVLFGHVAVITGGLRTASVRAVGDIRLLVIPTTTVLELLRGSEMRLTSPFRRAMIVALARQLYSATATAMQLALDAGITETSEYETPTNRLKSLPEDTQERLVRARGLL